MVGRRKAGYNFVECSSKYEFLNLTMFLSIFCTYIQFSLKYRDICWGLCCAMVLVTILNCSQTTTSHFNEIRYANVFQTLFTIIGG